MKFYQLATISVAISILGCSQKHTDFDVVCESFNQLQAQIKSVALNSNERAVFITDRVASNLPAESHARIAWEAIVHGPASERYNLFVETAESSGARGWSCLSMKNLAASVEFDY